jgi:hypothetical protein
MRRLVPAVVLALAVGVAAPASANNTGQQPPGPPLQNPNNNTLVTHCLRSAGGTSVIVLNPNGFAGHGNCIV